MEFILFFVGGLLAGGIVLWIIFASRRPDAGGGISRDHFESGFERIQKVLREEIAQNRRESVMMNKDNREEMARVFRELNEGLSALMEKNEVRLKDVRDLIEKRLESIQKDNTEKLERMRETVDEKLHATLEKRLGESFKLVSERLDLVHKGLGEMQTLATGVGDLKKVLSNVKTRGTWGEVQLENLLEQFMTPEQYEKNVATKKGSADRVEFAIKIPAKDEKVKNLWLPIDSKFPLEDFQNLIAAEEKGDLALAESLGKRQISLLFGRDEILEVFQREF